MNGDLGICRVWGLELRAQDATGLHSLGRATRDLVGSLQVVEPLGVWAGASRLPHPNLTTFVGITK